MCSTIMDALIDGRIFVMKLAVRERDAATMKIPLHLTQRFPPRRPSPPCPFGKRLDKLGVRKP